MILIDKLKELNPNEIVFIGSNSAFFFIGTPSEFEEQRIRLNSEWEDKFSRSLKNAENALALHKSTKPAKNEPSTTKKVWNIDGNIGATRVAVDYDEKLKNWETKLETLERSVTTRCAVLYNFTDFGEREVVDCYRNMNNDANIIIVKGEETARFWFREEYLRYINGEEVVIDSDSEGEEDEVEEDTDTEEDGE